MDSIALIACTTGLVEHYNSPESWDAVTCSASLLVLSGAQITLILAKFYGPVFIAGALFGLVIKKVATDSWKRYNRRSTTGD